MYLARLFGKNLLWLGFVSFHLTIAGGIGKMIFVLFFEKVFSGCFFVLGLEFFAG